MADKYLSIWNACNLECQFCYNDLLRSKKTFFADLKDLYRQVIEIKKTNDRINIIWWEPFLYPNISELLLFIKKQWFKKVLIVTNGTKLSSIDFSILLYKYSVNSLEFSIHSNSVEIEKLITKRSWKSFLEREQWIKNIHKLNNKFENKLSLSSNTVINFYNYKEINNIINYIWWMWIKNIALSFIYNLKWLSVDNKKLLVKYSDVIKILNKYENNKNLNIEIDWLPYCLHKNIKSFAYIIREENSWKNMYLDSKIKYKVKLKECSKCEAYWKLCDGVFKDYVEKFWDDEFNAI